MLDACGGSTDIAHSGPWLSPAVSPVDCGLSGDLFNRSMAQNEVLFSSEGLTLVSLDRMYSLKSALSSYSKTRSPLRLEDAVDELRRFVLAGGGVKVTKADLLRSYDWLGVSGAAVADLDRMYRRAYGGPEGVGAISGMLPPPPPLTPEPRVWAREDDGFRDVGGDQLDSEMIGLALTTMEPTKPPSPRGPFLRLQTSFETRPLLAEEPPDDGEDDDADLTARPRERLTMGFDPWPSSSIDQVLSAGPARSSRDAGPTTPNGYDDISPITRGEWGFMMVGNALQGGRTVAVETF